MTNEYRRTQEEEEAFDRQQESQKRRDEEPTTPEEEALGDLLKKNRELLSEAAHTIFSEAGLAAYRFTMVHNYCYQLKELYEAMEKMRLAATQITERDWELLAEIVGAGKAAAASIDPNDETPIGYGAYRRDVHRYHNMASGLIEDILEELEELEAYHKMAIAAMKELREELKEDG